MFKSSDFFKFVKKICRLDTDSAVDKENKVDSEKSLFQSIVNVNKIYNII